jgi:D-alanine-D-alanine ligase
MKVAILVDRASLAARSPSENLRATVAAIERALRLRGYDPSVAGLSDLKRLRPDVVFNLCESIDGDPRREAEAVETVRRMGFPITGNPARALRAALDKTRAKAILRRAGLRVPRTCIPGTGLLRFPAIVKPRREDASIGIDRGAVVRTGTEARRQIARLKSEAVVEEFVDGREFNVSVLGGEMLAVSEIDFSRLPAGAPRIVTYDGKWRPRSADYRGTEPICPARVAEPLAGRLRDAARRSYRALGCRGAARVDVRVDARNRVFVIEVNPNPDLAPAAGFARAARARGWSYDELIDRILRGR